MDRALRILAIITLLSIGLFVALVRLLDAVQQPAMGSGVPSAMDLLLPALPGILVNLVGQTSFALCLAVGVVALVASIQRRQIGWAVGLVVLLLVAANGSSFAVELSPLVDNPQYLPLAPYVGVILSALVPVAALIYTFSPRSGAVQPATVAE